MTPFDWSTSEGNPDEPGSAVVQLVLVGVLGVSAVAAGEGRRETETRMRRTSKASACSHDCNQLFMRMDRVIKRHGCRSITHTFDPLACVEC